MKKRLFCLFLVLLLSGCTAMLESENWSVTPHVERPDTADDSSIPRVETYQQLVNTVFSFVAQGVDRGVIHLYNYARDVDTDLKNACNEVSQVDPFGAYAVAFMSYDFTRTVKYYQAAINITYLHTPEQIGSMVRVTGSSAIRDIMRVKLTQFAPEAVLRVDYFTEDAEKIRALVQQAYYDAPVAALGMPRIGVTLYPDPANESEASKGGQRVVEISLKYPEDVSTLSRKSDELRTQAESLAYGLTARTGGAAAEAIATQLRRRVALTPTRSTAPTNTAYAALVENRADSEGMALAFQLLAENLALESTVVCGTQDGAPHFWNVIALESGGWRHVDAANGKTLLMTDQELAALGYSWEKDTYPACGAPALPPDSTPAGG